MSDRNEARAQGQGRIYQASGNQHITEHHHHEAESSGGTWPGLDTVRWPSVGRAPAVLRDRSELMGHLQTGLSQDAGGQVYVLHGLGGCGKTAVAHALFEYATAEAGRLGLWVNASDTASLRTGMLAVAADRGAGTGELSAARSGLRAAADLVWDHLDQSVERWFLVLDNADDPAVLRDGGWLRSSPQGTVLVTTRQAAEHWWPGAELLHVGLLPKEDAARVLCDLAPAAGTVEDAEIVAERLGRLPLALTLAGVFLARQVIEPWTMVEYGRNLDGALGLDPIELLDQGAVAVGGDSRHLVSSTWGLSLNSLIRQGVPEAVTLLRLLACWAGDPLPLSLLSGVDVGGALARHRVELALRGLLDHSLTELVSGAVRCLRTHGVLLDSVWRGVPEEDRGQLVLVAARQLLSTLPEIPERGELGSRTSMMVPHTVGLLRRVADESKIGHLAVEAAAEASLGLVVALHRGGEYAPALMLAELAVQLLMGRLGADHPMVLRLRERVGRAIYRLGRFEEAAAVHRQILPSVERVFGSDGPEVAVTCLGLSRAMIVSQGSTPEVIELVRRAINHLTGTLGATHQLTLRARTDLLEFDRDITAGLPLIEDCRRELGAQNATTLMAQWSYALALHASGEPEQALPIIRPAFKAIEEEFGATYPLTLNARTLLSQVLYALGDRAAAIQHAEAIFAGRIQALGPGHPWTVNAREYLTRFRDGR